MSTFIVVPSLSTLGWVTDAENKMDLLISHFFLSDYNQTYLYVNNVTSLPRIVESNGNDTNGLISELKNSLINYLNRYYDTVNVSVADQNADLTDAITISLNIRIEVTDNGITNIFTRLLQSNNGKMNKIAKLNNY